jgi:hypothetical protein
MHRSAEAEEGQIKRSASGASATSVTSIKSSSCNVAYVGHPGTFGFRGEAWKETKSPGNDPDAISAVVEEVQVEEAEEGEWTQLCNLNKPGAKWPRTIIISDDHPHPYLVHPMKGKQCNSKTPTSSGTSSGVNEWDELCVHFHEPHFQHHGVQQSEGHKRHTSETMAESRRDSKKIMSVVFELQELNTKGEVVVRATERSTD